MLLVLLSSPSGGEVELTFDERYHLLKAARFTVMHQSHCNNNCVLRVSGHTGVLAKELEERDGHANSLLLRCLRLPHLRGGNHLHG